MHGHGHQILDYLTWALAPSGGASLALLLFPNPDRLAEIFLIAKAPRAYIIFYNILRYIANLKLSAGWEERQGMVKIASEAEKV